MRRCLFIMINPPAARHRPRRILCLCASLSVSFLCLLLTYLLSFAGGRCMVVVQTPAPEPATEPTLEQTPVPEPAPEPTPTPKAHLTLSPGRSTYLFNCTNIPNITFKGKLGHGYFKQSYLGVDNKGRKVVIKVAHQDNSRATTKLMREILHLDQIHHPNLINMLGYCVRGMEAKYTPVIKKRDIIAIQEFATSTITKRTIESWSFQRRLKTAIELADLLDYLEHSPLGSLRITDFKYQHFLLKNGVMKLIDIDSLMSSELICLPQLHDVRIASEDAQSQQTGSTCESFGLQCIAGVCPGFNAKKNIQHVHRLFFKTLLFEHTPDDVRLVKDGDAILDKLQSQLDVNSICAREIKSMLHPLLDES